MATPIERICEFNKQANLVGYKASLEASFLVEEALEGFDLWDAGREHWYGSIS